MFCHQCGEAAGDEAKVCAKCGAVLVAAASQTAPALSPDQEQPRKMPVVRRWVRFWARTMDMDLYFLLIGAIAAFVDPYLLSQLNQLTLGLLLLFSWVFVEAWLLSTFHTTPGKWLLRVNIALASGQPITYRKALARSFMVWWRGMGIGIPFLTTITLIVSSIVIARNGITPWDAKEGFVITHADIGMPRILAATAFFSIILLLMILGESVKH